MLKLEVQDVGVDTLDCQAARIPDREELIADLLAYVRQCRARCLSVGRDFDVLLGCSSEFINDVA